MKNFSVLLLAGDGIGVETTKQALKVLNYFQDKKVYMLEVYEGLIGGAAYEEHKTPLPDETLEIAKKADAVLLGAVGGEKWDNLDFNLRPEAGLLGIRKELGLFANLRPAIVFDELVEASSLKKELVSGLDILFIRELTGGLYFGEPRGRKTLPSGEEAAYNSMYYRQTEISRIIKLAFDIARKRSKKVCSVDKANVLEVMRFWREIANKESENYQDINLSHMYVDNAAMQLVSNPKQFDVIVCENMFGDILSDCAAAITGSIGILPSASFGDIKEYGKRNALYEPVHGSAPDIAGKNIANPIAQILSLAMMLRYSFNLEKQAKEIEDAVQNVLKKGYRTADIFTEKDTLVSTEEMGDYIIEELNLMYS